jgi:hypothetical protein
MPKALRTNVQAFHGVADRGLCHREAGRGTRQAAFGHHAVEDAQQVQVECAEVHDRSSYAIGEYLT